MVIETFILILLFAFICEWIDSALGMGYGTILSPILIIFGFSPLIVVPSILLSQAIGGFSASIFHHKNKNACFSLKSKNPFFIIKKIKEYGLKESFKKGVSEDLKIVFIISTFGIIATIIAVLIAVNISKLALNTYIGILVLVIGVLLLFGFSMRYSSTKMFVVGLISAFNKGMSGGGFGPFVTGGQIVLGKEHKSAIGCTTAAEFPICITGFITYLLTNGLQSWDIAIPLCIGALSAGIIGPLTTKKISKNTLKYVVAILLVGLGIYTLLKAYGIVPW